MMGQMFADKQLKIGSRALFSYTAWYDVTEFSNCHIESKAKLSSFVQFENEMLLHFAL